MSRFGGALAPVGILEPDDVVQLGRRDLDDRRVLDCAYPVDGAGLEPERGARSHHFTREHPLPGRAELELDPALEDVPRLVLDVVELEAERLPRFDMQQ